MVKFGILTEKQYQGLERKRRRLSAAHVAYNLLNVGENPKIEQIQVFEDVSFTLRTSNGTFRTTYRNRFVEVDQASLRWMRQIFPAEPQLRVQDRAVSHGLTSKEFAEKIFTVYPDACYEASDLLLGLVELRLASDEIYVAERDGTPLQYIKSPFVVALYHPEPRRYPLNRWVAARAKRRFHELNLPVGWTLTDGGPGYKVRSIPFIHPEALALSKANPSFSFRERSVFDRTPGACHVLRTMNIFNRAYFSEEQVADGIAAARENLVPGGLWIVGRTLEEDFSNHVSFLRRAGNSWEVLERIGKGWEMEAIVGALKQ